MLKLILLLTILLLGMVFTIIPDGIALKEMGYPFSSVQVTLQTWCYFLFEAIVKIILAWIIYSESQKFRTPLFIFFAIQVLDLIDYVLTYNTVWFNVGIIPISMNTVGVTIFVLSIIPDYKKW